MIMTTPGPSFQHNNKSPCLNVHDRQSRKRSRTTTTTTTTNRRTMKTIVTSLSITVVFSLLPLLSHAWTTASSRSMYKSSSPLSVTCEHESPISSLLAPPLSSDFKKPLDLRMSQQQQQLNKPPPSMFLGVRSFSPSTLSSSPAIERSRLVQDSSNKKQAGDKHDSLLEVKSSSQHQQQRGVLGFDVFELEASTNPSQVDLKSWDTPQENFFPTPSSNGGGLLTATTPFVTTSSTVPFVPTRSTGLGPAWLPWIPTKSQIQSLKVSELKEACGQRSLLKTGKKADLQKRLWKWVTEQQQQSGGDFLVDWFENDTSTTISSSVVPDITITKMDGTSTTADVLDSSLDNIPNSVQEWARTVDLDSLFQKRKNIHREKLQGKRPAGSKNQKQKQQRGSRIHAKQVSEKDYLMKLSKALQAPSSPYASNVKVKELYMASKKADQIGEREVAIDLLQTLLDVTPNDARVYRRLARMYSEQDELDHARETLQRGLDNCPDNPWLFHGLGQLELTYGCQKAARKYFEQAIESDPAFPQSYHAWGTLEHTSGNIAKAMKILKRGIEYCPTNHRLHHALGDLYRGAKLLGDADRSYRRALKHSPPVSRCFAYSALAAVAYEKCDMDEARLWMKNSITQNDGRHAQGWLALAQMEEAEGNIDNARKVCNLAISRYERGLIEKHKRYSKRGPIRGNSKHRSSSPSQQNRDRDYEKDHAVETKELLLRHIPRYRPGDKFLKVYRNWARLEENNGSFESVDEVYRRALLVFPNEYKIALDWASYYATMLNHGRARLLFLEACNKAANRHADPYRLYGEHEMSLRNYEQARKILFLGAQAVSQRSEGGLGNRRGLAELFHTWALCEWHLDNLPRAEILFDHALRLAEAGEGGSELRSYILYSIARLEVQRGKFYVAQHCIGLCLKENKMPGGNSRVWRLWADVALAMGNNQLEQKCRDQMEKTTIDVNDQGNELSRLLSGSGDPALLRRDPWQCKLFGMSANETKERFYTFGKFPWFQQLEKS